MRTQHIYSRSKSEGCKVYKIPWYKGSSKAVHYHHKNAARWLKEDLNLVKVTSRSKSKNNKGQGEKWSNFDEELYVDFGVTRG